MAVTLSPEPPVPAAGRRLAVPEWLRRPGLLRVFAVLAAVVNGMIAVTGATVRVTGSGLGCITWPQCQPGSLVPVPATGGAALRQAIEFSNRTLTGVALIASLGTFLLCLLARPRRPGILRLALVGPIGVLLQAVWGGLVVLTGLKWWTVAPHFLASMVILFFAIAVAVRLGEPDGPGRPLVPPLPRVLTGLCVAVVAALCVAGTLVTAAGPHSGDANTTRLDVPITRLVHVHAALLYLFLALLVVVIATMVRVRAPRRVLIRLGVVVVVSLAQGTIGLVQYALAIPEALVIAHVFGAVVLVTCTALVWFATRTRGAAGTRV